MKHSSKRVVAKKPRADFPLFPHQSDRWAKKIRGKLHYFGKVSTDTQGKEALVRWLEQKDDLLAGRVPRAKRDELTVADVCNAFLEVKEQLLNTGEIRRVTWDHYKRSCGHIVETFGRNRSVADLAPDDFAKLRNMLTGKWGPVAMVNEIQRVRSVFKYAYDAGLIDKPMRFGPAFTRPSKKTLRLNRAKQAPKLYSAADVNSLLKSAPRTLKAMILLAINCAFGNADCATLPMRVLDLERGWIDYPRPKTGVARRCPLWPETVEAIREVIAKRKEPDDEAHKELLFITKQGGSFFKETPDNPISNEFAKLLKELKLTQKGRGFYALRHTFRTVADESRDQPACDHIMGHAGEHISSHYRERIDDSRLLAVSNYVREWLYGKEGETNGQA